MIGNYQLAIPFALCLIVERVPKQNWNLYGLVWDGGQPSTSNWADLRGFMISRFDGI